MGAAITQVRESLPEFAAWLNGLDLDVVIPLIDLGHEGFWHSDPAAAWGEKRSAVSSRERKVRRTAV